MKQTNIKTNIGAAIFFLLMMACESKPKTIEAIETSPTMENQQSDESATAIHKGVVEDILQTSKYTYLYMSGEGENKWIAIPKSEIEIGETYYYRGGLKKNNFKSTEHDRVFETVYLVSGVGKDPASIGATGGNPHLNTHPGATTDENTKIEPPTGGITIATLLANPKKYDGQTVRVKGRCIKVNNMIMNRNWVHLQDGSLTGETQDLTITTTENIPVGAIVALEGKITLNKDFGAGYKYEILMEEAKLLQ